MPYIILRKETVHRLDKFMRKKRNYDELITELVDLKEQVEREIDST
jgi:hypothetical protein